MVSCSMGGRSRFFNRQRLDRTSDYHILPQHLPYHLSMPYTSSRHEGELTSEEPAACKQHPAFRERPKIQHQQHRCSYHVPQWQSLVSEQPFAHTEHRYTTPMSSHTSLPLLPLRLQDSAPALPASFFGDTVSAARCGALWLPVSDYMLVDTVSAARCDVL